MKVLLGFVGLTLLVACAGCLEGGYGGVYGRVSGEYPSTYYGGGTYVEPYPYVYGAPYGREHYWGRHREWERGGHLLREHAEHRDWHRRD